MAGARILFIEDEPAIRDAITGALLHEGFRVHAAADGRGFEEIVGRFRPDLAILDVMLPGGRDGFSLARELRRASDLPILFLTARDAPPARLRGFQVGGDDYVIKPVFLEELLARVRALLRRAGRLRSPIIEIGDLVIDQDAAAVTRAGQAIDLTATELRLLTYLARNRGRVLSKLEILTQVWGYEDYDPNLVEVNVSAVRRKLEARGPRLIHTVRGHGYLMRAAGR
ncbi:MAG TPA: response regulator transcription factor [Solirubrobacteraceae bacterium]|nr:response regulator transcription factor [Solirubrobacteraceae bacterium]